MKCPMCGADMAPKDSYAIPLPDKHTAIVCKACWDEVFSSNLAMELDNAYMYGAGTPTRYRAPAWLREEPYGKDL